jgi:hypothetical protein
MERVEQNQPFEPEQPAVATVEPGFVMPSDEELENAPIVMEAEQVITSAFRGWVQKSGLGETRATSVLNAPDKPTSKLNQRELNLVMRRADVAIARSYADIKDPELY